MSEKVILMQDDSSFQDLLKQGQMMETDIREMKLMALRQDLQVGIDQLEAGEYTAYTEEGLDKFFEELKCYGRGDLRTLLSP